MKLAPVSADLVIKLAIAGVAVLGVLYVLGKVAGAAASAASGALSATGDALQAVNPLNNENVLYQTANRITGGSDDLPLGVRIYDFFHKEEKL